MSEKGDESPRGFQNQMSVVPPMSFGLHRTRTMFDGRYRKPRKIVTIQSELSYDVSSIKIKEEENDETERTEKHHDITDTKSKLGQPLNMVVVEAVEAESHYSYKTKSKQSDSSEQYKEEYTTKNDTKVSSFLESRIISDG